MSCTNTEFQTMANPTSSTDVASIQEIIEDSLPGDIDELMEWECETEALNEQERESEPDSN